jgi:pimeloyl-ACP methyl ester carboxylesterase
MLPIIILHGWNLSGEKFSPLSDLLKLHKYPVFSPDLPGFGNNYELKKTLTLDDYVKFLQLYISKLGCEKVILIGHSFGGRVAIKYSVKNPEKVTLLFLTGVPGLPPVRKMKVMFFLIISKVGKYIFKFPLLSPFEAIFRKYLYKGARAGDYYKASGLLKKTFLNVINEDLIGYMKKLTVKTVLIWGKDDHTVSYKIAVKMSKLMTRSTLHVTEGENHRYPYSSPIKFYSIMKRYLSATG